MGKYTVIAEVGQRLQEILAESLTPGLIQDKNGIGLCGPEDRGDVSLGIYLYDIRENGELKVNGMVGNGLREQKYPPQVLSLYYMLTAYSASDVKFRAVQEHRILGRAMQALNDRAVIPASELGNETAGLDMRIEFLDLSAEEKMKLWNDTGKPYKLSVCYRVTPVELESTRRKEIRRVTELELRFEEKERGRNGRGGV